MKNLKSRLSLFLAACTVAASVPLAASAQESLLREHRAIWMSPSLSNNWPSNAITSSNKDTHIRNLRTRLNNFKNQGINVIYYHARTNCDATYKSSYEPWNVKVAGSRGAQAPAIDPLETVIAEAHAVGIEVYAWMNPYRYSHGEYYGSGELNYENSHPDWLLATPDQIILDPSREDVRQRIIDVVSEVVTNYDVDGVIFDDYFYINDDKNTYDSHSYKAYTDAGGKLDLFAWRRANVNDMICRVQGAVKSIKPYCVFGISPAGTVSPADVATYGLLPGPHGDWQYDGIASDPLKWLSNGWIDFLSPQVYWADKYNSLTDWFAIAVPHLGRHLYTSVTLQDILTDKVGRTIHEVDYQRASLRPNQSGVAFFEYGPFVNYYEKYDGKSRPFGEIMQMSVFPTKALTPLRNWENLTAPAMVSDVRADGTTLRWTAPAAQTLLRYTVYALPSEADASAFAQQRDYLAGVTYTDSYDISAFPAGTRFAVASYDRYGNESAPLFQGATAAQCDPATLVAPVSGTPDDLFDFSWSSATRGRYLIEMSESASFDEIIAVNETSATTLPVSAVADLEDGKTYYWRVRTFAPDHTEAVSAPASFTASRIALTAPAAGTSDVVLNPVISWTKAAEGSSYTLEIAITENFASVVYSATTDACTHTVPERTLVSGRKYYARVTARRGNAVSVSRAVAFNTADRSDYAAPEFTNPTQNGQTLYSNSTIAVKPYEGLTGVNIQISATESFPGRSIYTTTLSDFQTESTTLDRVKISSKALVDGKTYYLRARGTYYLSTATAVQYTPFTPVYTFVYSSETGIRGVQTADQASFVDSENILHLAGAATAVEIYDAAGRLVASVPAGKSEIALGDMRPGAYIIRIISDNTETLKWIRQ